MNEQAFELLMARFDRLEDQNAELKKCFEEHLKADAAVHRTVEKHSTYWAIVWWVISPLGAGAAAWLGFHK